MSNTNTFRGHIQRAISETCDLLRHMIRVMTKSCSWESSWIIELTMSFRGQACKVDKALQRSQWLCPGSHQGVPTRAKHWHQGPDHPSTHDTKDGRIPKNLKTWIHLKDWVCTCMASICLGDTSSGRFSLQPVFSWNRVALMELWNARSSSVNVPLQVPFLAKSLHLF